jgi:predicted RNA binding protein with dsRBD fold (UPF0201 family)
MKNNNRNLLMLSCYFITKEELDYILTLTESSKVFCTAHELLNRNHITSKAQKILRESKRNALRSFRFLLNKN